MLFIIRRYLYFLLEHKNLGDNYKLRMIFPLHFTSCIWQWLNVTQCPQLGDNYMYNELLRLCVSQAELFLIFMNSLHNYYIIILFKLYGSIISSSKLHYPFRNVYTYQKKPFPSTTTRWQLNLKTSVSLIVNTRCHHSCSFIRMTSWVS